MSSWLSRQPKTEYETQIMWALVAALEAAAAHTLGDPAVRTEVMTALTNVRAYAPTPGVWAETLADSLVRLVTGLRRAEAAAARLDEVQAERDRLRHDLDLWLADPLQAQVRVLRSERDGLSQHARQLAERVRQLEADQVAAARTHAAEVARLEADSADLQAIVARQQLLLAGASQPDAATNARGGQRAAKRAPRNAED